MSIPYRLLNNPLFSGSAAAFAAGGVSGAVPEDALSEAVPAVLEDVLSEAVPAVLEDVLPEAVPAVLEDALSEAVQAVLEDVLSEAVPDVPEDVLSEAVPVVPEDALSETIPAAPETALSEAASKAASAFPLVILAASVAVPAAFFAVPEAGCILLVSLEDIPISPSRTSGDRLPSPESRRKRVSDDAPSPAEASREKGSWPAKSVEKISL